MGVLVIVFIISFVASVIVEMPFRNLDNLLFQTNKSNPPAKNYTNMPHES